MAGVNKQSGERYGVPIWRTGKPDVALAEAKGFARNALRSLAAPEEVGDHCGAKREGDRLVTHLFDCNKAGYVQWRWFVVLARAPRSKTITVNEVGLVPSEGSVLPPPWLPWAKRVLPEDLAKEESAANEELQ